MEIPTWRSWSGSARSAPMYRAAIMVAVRTSSSGSSDSSASPWTWTNAYGGSSRSTHRLARGSRARARPFAVPRPVLNTRLSPSTTNQTGATSGRPLAARKASLPVRVPCARKSLTRGSLRDATLGPDRVTQAEHPPFPAQRRGHHPVAPRRADGRPVARVLQDLGVGQLVPGQKASGLGHIGVSGVAGTGAVQRASEPEPADPPPAGPGHGQPGRAVLVVVPVVELRLVDRTRVGVDVEKACGHRERTSRLGDNTIVCQAPRMSRRPRDGAPPRGLMSRTQPVGAQSAGAAIGLIPDRSSRLTRIVTSVMISASAMIPAETRYPWENPCARAWLLAAFCAAACWAVDR